MLTVLKAIAIDVKAIHSGSTKPCLMTLADENGTPAGEYVVKIFKPNTLLQANNTHKEVFGSVLAEAFCLKTPKPVLAKVDQKIIDALNKSEKYKGFNLEKGVYFAAEFIENALDYSKATELNLEDWEIENTFAFDVLIRNIDRHERKPNLFFKDREIYLIDHELCFATSLLQEPFLKMAKEMKKYWNFIEVDTPSFRRKHIFLEELRERNKVNSVTFYTFREYLRNFDPEILDVYQQQLNDFGNDMDGYYSIRSYLIEVKQNADIFVQLLKDLIT